MYIYIYLHTHTCGMYDCSYIYTFVHVCTHTHTHTHTRACIVPLRVRGLSASAFRIQVFRLPGTSGLKLGTKLLGFRV